MNENTPEIWSSSTLYSPEIIRKRKEWFHNFLQNPEVEIDEEQLIEFHTKTQNKDSENGLIINRNKEMLTKNITQFVLENKSIKLSHYDLINHTKFVLTEL